MFSIFLGLTLLRVLKGQVSFDLNLIWWWLGGVIGFLFVFADRLVYAFKSHTGETFSLKLKLMMRSVLFVVVWVILTILTMTSVANTFSRGFMLGLGTHLVFDLGWDYFFSRKDINSWFWQIKNVTELEKNVFVWGAFVFYSLTVWFL